GGSVRFDYSLYDDMWNPNGLPAGAEVELVLTPEAGTTLYGAARTFRVTRKIGNGNGNFVLNNIPVGRYAIQARLAGGQPLKMTASGPYVSVYPHQGLHPRTATGTARVWFTPMSAEASAPPVLYGYWRPVAITLEQP
ncbi:MAG TPA: hypothetical protein VHK69_01950, partial [Chitinophagaceae bacterium]|nr:hypothetical protein [Chitinophagaceae bacterium]